MNIRMLIARAIQEARAEFEAIVVQRLATLMGDDAPAAKSKPAAPKRVKAAAAPAKSKAKPGKKKAAPAKAKATAKPAAKGAPAKKAPAGPVDDVVLRALGKGDAMGKSAIMKAGGYVAKDDTRVGLALLRLRNDGKITMSGTRRGATYRIAKKGAAHAPAADAVHAPAAETTIVNAPAPMEMRARRSRPVAEVVTPEPAWRPTVIRRQKSE